MHYPLSFNSQYSRTFLLVTMGIDASLLAVSYILSTHLLFHSLTEHLFVVAVLSWWALLMLTRQHHPECLKSHKIISTTFSNALVHIALMAIICVTNKETSNIWLLAQLTLFFSVFRIITFVLLYKVHSYARYATDNTLRFIIIGDKKSKVSQLLHNYLLQNEATFMGYIDENSIRQLEIDEVLRLYQKLRKQKVSHIYCTLPLPQWTVHINKLQQIADDHFMYFHWLADFNLKDSLKQHLDFQTKDLMVYIPYR